MKILQPAFKIEAATPNIEKVIEKAGRVCWKSEDRITDDSYLNFIEMLMGVNHASVLEHGAITVKIRCDRGVSHELVRHRIASYSQESTRYCNYSKGKFDSEISVIEPYFFPKGRTEYDPEGDRCYWLWHRSMLLIEETYIALIESGAKAQEARAILPNCLKTEITVTANPREWRHFFLLRTAEAAHPQMRQVMCGILAEFRNRWPILFNNVGTVEHPCPAVIDESL